MSAPAVAHYAVIGHPVAHSRSPEIHALFAEQCRQNMTYTRLPAPRDGFTPVASHFFEQGGAGLNVTMPFKQQAAALADQLTDRARQAGAVNTLMATPEGLLGDNTDGAGLSAALTHHLGVTLAGRKLLILGAGGAVRGVLPGLLAAGSRHITIANRTLDKAQDIARDCATLGAVEACSLDQAPHDADLVINAISAGLIQQRMPTITAHILDQATAAYDMIYADQATPFMQWARQHGLKRVRDGFDMLVEQAAESFSLWRGIRPDTAPVIARLRPAHTEYPTHGYYS